MKTLFTVLFMIIAPFMSFSQESSYKAEPLTEYIAPIVKEGSYQVILKDHRMLEPELTSGILNKISTERKQESVSYIYLDEYTTIKILPFKTINSVSFVPLKKYVYEN